MLYFFGLLEKRMPDADSLSHQAFLNSFCYRHSRISSVEEERQTTDVFIFGSIALSIIEAIHVDNTFFRSHA